MIIVHRSKHCPEWDSIYVQCDKCGRVDRCDHAFSTEPLDFAMPNGWEYYANPSARICPVCTRSKQHITTKAEE